MTREKLRGDSAVIDASVAAIWHLPDEQFSNQAEQLLLLYRAGEVELHAPAHILHEVPSAITVATRGRNARLSVEEGRAAIDRFLQLGIDTLNGEVLPREAYEFAQQTGVSFYDALYGALSLRLGMPLVLADRAFYRSARTFAEMVWIGDL